MICGSGQAWKTGNDRMMKTGTGSDQNTRIRPVQHPYLKECIECIAHNDNRYRSKRNKIGNFMVKVVIYSYLKQKSVKVNLK